MAAAASLEGVILKIERATEHLDAARDLIRDASALDGALIRHEQDPATAERVIRLSGLPQPPARLSVLTGDFFHCCRSALDYLAWQLVKHPNVPTSEDAARDDEIAFPIFLDPSRYTTRRIKGCTKEAQNIVYALQPFQSGRPEAHPLWLLHGLSNWDKHRVLHTMSNTLAGSGFALGEENVPSATFVPLGPIAPNAELVRYANPVDPKAKIYFYFGLDVTFADGPASGLKVDVVMTEVFDALIETSVRLFNQLAVDEHTVAAPDFDAVFRRLSS